MAGLQIRHSTGSPVGLRRVRYGGRDTSARRTKSYRLLLIASPSFLII